MYANHGTSTLPVQIQIAYVEVLTRALETIFILRVHSAGQTVLGVVRNTQRILVVARLDEGEHRTESLFLRDLRIGFYIGDDGGRYEITLIAILRSAAEHEATFLRTDVDVLIDLVERLLVDDRAHERRL